MNLNGRISVVQLEYTIIGKSLTNNTKLNKNWGTNILSEGIFCYDTTL